jgi:hypothetical protein
VGDEAQRAPRDARNVGSCPAGDRGDAQRGVAQLAVVFLGYPGLLGHSPIVGPSVGLEPGR